MSKLKETLKASHVTETQSNMRSAEGHVSGTTRMEAWFNLLVMDLFSVTN